MRMFLGDCEVCCDGLLGVVKWKHYWHAAPSFFEIEVNTRLDGAAWLVVVGANEFGVVVGRRPLELFYTVDGAAPSLEEIEWDYGRVNVTRRKHHEKEGMCQQPLSHLMDATPLTLAQEFSG